MWVSFFFSHDQDKFFFFFPCGSSFFFSFYVWVKFFFFFYLWVGQVFFFTKTSCSPPWSLMVRPLSVPKGYQRLGSSHITNVFCIDNDICQQPTNTMLIYDWWFQKALLMLAAGRGHWPRKGVWGCAALKTPFSCLSCSSQGSHFKHKSQLTRPLLS